MTKLLIEYANKRGIILDINEYNKNRECPLLVSIEKNNIEMTKLLLEYANEYSININSNVKKEIQKIFPVYEFKNEIHDNKNSKSNDNININANTSTTTTTTNTTNNNNSTNTNIKTTIKTNIKAFSRPKTIISTIIDNKNKIKVKNYNNNENDVNRRNSIFYLYKKRNPLAEVLNDFSNEDEKSALKCKKGDQIIIVDWNYPKEGWAFGYKYDDPSKKGIIPKSLVSYKDSKSTEEPKVMNMPIPNNCPEAH
ncbi:hypothetical protein BCR32DRAFT_328556 [Anaeromyces robustus]|uniref:SH3 domain-containing protein n=1 Tax=Anaeromyces robustus TaxID=1754192 RepID=A0A1Y1WXX6_9FUNG|nr:hypothetical protein BCR32DRAFT_328556 [Anaeromyces robustus]|eukprot:ORX78417.1 hypothetical protein BCR32DRAFT_328556 [Anaeromyces robustus]